MRRTITIKVTNIVGDTFGYDGINEVGFTLFKNTFENTTEGITEFIGAVHALMYLKKNDLNADIYVKNPYIKECIESKQYKHKAKGNKASESLNRCILWLLDRKSTIIVYLISNESTKQETPDVSSKFQKQKTWFND